MSDKESNKYKKYTNLIEKTLLSFDSVNEWADFIGFLNRLNKALTSYEYNTIPKRTIVSKRLAQCLNPVLPGGVHQKALEVYRIIFSKITTEDLVKHLPIYSSGLFPFFSNATMTVKPAVLDLFEAHFIPLGLKLLPCLKSLIMALLPGLEEESGEFFSRVYSMFSDLKTKVKVENFQNSVWICLLLAPQFRLSVINYLSKYSKESSTIEDFCGKDFNLVSKAMAAAMADKNILVVRGVLEILVVKFPLQERLFSLENTRLLAKSLLTLLLKREMSLNRRVHAWLLGSQEDPANENLQEFPLSIVCSALREMLAEKDLESAVKPFKILVSLMDKPQIGNPVINEIFVEILESLKNNCKSTTASQEILQAANIFFEMVDLSLVWSKLSNFIKSQGDPELVLFAIKNLKICDQEANKIHEPIFFVSVLEYLYSKDLFDESCSLLLRLAIEIYHHIPSSILVGKVCYQLTESDIKRFSFDVQQVYTSKKSDSFSDILSSFVQQSLKKSLGLLESFKFLPELVLQEKSILDSLAKLVSLLAGHQDKINKETTRSLLFADDFKYLKTLIFFVTNFNDIDIFSIAISLISNLIANGCFDLNEFSKLVSMETIYIQVWNFLDSFPLRSTELLLLLHCLNQKSVEYFITGQIQQGTQRIESIKKFIQFWKYSDDLCCSSFAFTKPLFAMLECTRERNREISKSSLRWFRFDVQIYSRILNPALLILLDPKVACEARKVEINNKNFIFNFYLMRFDEELTIFSLEYLKNLILDGDERFFKYLRSNKMEEMNRFDIKDIKSADFIVAIFNISKVFAFTESNIKDQKTTEIQLAAIDLILALVQRNLLVSKDQIFTLLEQVIFKLFLAVQTQETSVLYSLLNLFSLILSEPVDQNLLVDLLLYGMKSDPNSWLKFVLIGSNLVKDPVNLVFLPLLKCLNKELIDSFESFDEFYLFSKIEGLQGIMAHIQLNGLIQQEGIYNQKKANSTLNLSQFVKDVFSVEKSSSTVNFTEKSRISVLSYFVSIFKNLFEILCLSSRKEKDQNFFDSALESAKVHKQTRLEMKIETFCSTLYSIDKLTVIEAIIRLYGLVIEANEQEDLDFKIKIIFDLLACIEGDTMIILNLIFELYKLKSFSVQKDPQHFIEGWEKIPEIYFMKFLENFTANRCTFSALIETWPNSFNIIKDCISSPNRNKKIVFETLSWMFEIMNKMTLQSNLTSASASACLLIEDKKILKEQQENFVKLCEQTLNSTFTKKSSSSNALSSVAALSDVPATPKSALTSRSLLKFVDNKILNYFILKIIPNLKFILIDQEKILSIFSTLVNLLVSPNLKQSSSASSSVAFEILYEISKYPFSLKLFKNQVWDNFLIDLKYFESNQEILKKKKFILSILIQSDLDKFNDLLTKLTFNSNLFISKDQENQSKSLTIKRLSWLLFIGSTDQYTSYLPNIQEKIVDLFKSSICLIEIFFLLRIILMRFSNQHLSNLWPIVLTELIQIFHKVLKQETDSLDFESGKLLFSACKFLDLMFSLSNEEFLNHQWIFITESTRSVIDDSSVGMIDRLKFKWSKKHQAEHCIRQESIVEPDQRTIDSSERDTLSSQQVLNATLSLKGKRPILLDTQFTLWEPLENFIFSIGSHVINQALMLTSPDIEFIEDLIEKEFMV